MFGTKGKKGGLLDQVEEIAEDLADRLAPHVDNAREQIAPYIADARDKAGPAIADARGKAAPYVKEARDRFNDDVVPAVSAAVADARDKAAPYIEEARAEATKRGKATAAALKGEVEAPKKKGGKLKKVLLAGGVIGLGAFIFSKLKGQNADDGWQSSYVPPAPPAPAPKPAPTPATATDAGKPADSADDAAGSSPDEAAADAVEAPHAVTTPDEPVTETEIDKPPAS